MNTNTQNKGYEVYESEGIRFMEKGRDDLARASFSKAAELGCERARTFIQYLDMNVSDADFCEHAQEEEVFDYDLQPLFHVSRAHTVLKKAFMSVRNHIEAMADAIAWGCRVAIFGKPITNGISL